MAKWEGNDSQGLEGYVSGDDTDDDLENVLVSARDALYSPGWLVRDK